MAEELSSTETNFEEKLIAAVYAHECLFNKSSAAYRKKVCKEKAWWKIAKDVGMDVKECQHRWRSLRDRFVREIRLSSMSGNTSKKTDCKWKYLNQLLFLKPHLEQRTKSSSICLTDEETLNDTTHHKYNSLDYDINPSFTEYDDQETEGDDCFSPVSNSTASTSALFEKKAKQEIREEIAFVSLPSKTIQPKKRKIDPIEKIERYQAEPAFVPTQTRRSRNEDYYKTLDSYMLQLPEALQDDLKIEFLNRVYNEIKEN